MRHLTDPEYKVDFLGNGSFKDYDIFKVPAKSHFHHQFPQDFSAHCIRLETNLDCTATAYLMYN